MISLENASKPSYNPAAKPLRKPSPHQQSQDCYSSDFLVLTRHYRKINPNQRAAWQIQGQEQRQLWGHTWCQQQLVRGFFICGDLSWDRQRHVPMAEGTQPPSKQQTCEEWATGSRSQLPCPIPVGCHAVLWAQGLLLFPAAAERKGRAGKAPLGTS